jgi:hypothetical protein
LRVGLRRRIGGTPPQEEEEGGRKPGEETGDANIYANGPPLPPTTTQTHTTSSLNISDKLIN